MKLSRILVFVLILFSVDDAAAKNLNPRKIKKLIRKSAILNRHFTGFAIYDPAKKKMLADQFSDKYFTPASNTKLYTFYAGLNILGDSIPGLQYAERSDSLIFWGTGDPSFLNATLDNGRVSSFLKNHPKKLFFSSGRYTGDFFGTGWQLDDYNGSYQPEITELPIYENMARFSADKQGGLVVNPGRLQQGLTKDLFSKRTSFSVRRDIFSNTFYYPGVAIPKTYTQQVPMRLESSLLLNLLQDTLKRVIETVHLPVPTDAKTLYSIHSDTLYRHMLQPSDNFIAEHILLLCAAKTGKEMNSDVIIKYVTDTYLADLPDKPQWADGSGLSRMNLFTPRDMIALLGKIYEKTGDEKRLFSMLSIGGKAGTLRSLYKSETPFVFAKTGTLSNNYNQSGFLITKSGKRLIYSFMNNNYTDATAEIRKEMERIITLVHEKY